MEELCKTFNLMGVLQSVEVIQHQAQFVIAVFRQCFAALSGRHGIIEIAAKGYVRTQNQALTVEVKAAQICIWHQEIRQRLQRNQVQSVLHNQVNAVIFEIEYQFFSVTHEGARVHLFQQHRFPRRVKGVQCHHIHQRDSVFSVAERVIVHEIDYVFVKIDDHGRPVVPGFRIGRVTCPGGNRPFCLQRKTDLFSLNAAEIPKHFAEFIGFHVRQIIHSIHKIELHLHTCII